MATEALKEVAYRDLSVRSIDVDTASAVKTIDGRLDILKGHFPDFPIYPGVFLIESVMDLVSYHATFCGHQARILGVKSARFHAPVLPQDVIAIDCQFTEGPHEDLMLVKAKVSKNGRPAADVQLMYERQEI